MSLYFSDGHFACVYAVCRETYYFIVRCKGSALLCYSLVSVCLSVNSSICLSVHLSVCHKPVLNKRSLNVSSRNERRIIAHHRRTMLFLHERDTYALFQTATTGKLYVKRIYVQHVRFVPITSTISRRL